MKDQDLETLERRLDTIEEVLSANAERNSKVELESGVSDKFVPS